MNAVKDMWMVVSRSHNISNSEIRQKLELLTDNYSDIIKEYLDGQEKEQKE